jgi:hypothetical protein
MTTETVPEARQREQWFFGLMAALAAAIVFAGFAPTYYLGPWFAAPALTPLVHLHGIVFTAWIALLALQVGLVATGRTYLHRRVGVAGAVLALAMVVLGVATAIVSAQLGHTPNPAIPPLSFMAIPLFAIVAFALLVGAGVALRHRPQAHKRLMLLATIAILGAAMARLPLGIVKAGGPPAFFGLTDLLVLACVAYDLLTRRRVHPAWLLGGAVILASQVGSLLAAPSAPWLAFAHWLIS